MRILVAMSGGVDSSVAAHILKREGHEVVGVRFHLWSDPTAPALAKILPGKCCDVQTVTRARKVAENLQIEFHEVDLQKKFKTKVVEPFLEMYRLGKTPSPCIGCNRSLKFYELIKMADKLKCDKVATGHYARIETKKDDFGSTYFALSEASDKKKDQSYYLSDLTQSELSRILLPLGNKNKKEIFELAEKFAVPIDKETYLESQDLCFFPEKSLTPFLKRYLKNDLVPGDIVDRNGKILGKHKGLPLYTIGQRRIGVGGQRIPLEVVQKNYASNCIVVALKGQETTKTLTLSDVNWIFKPPSRDQVLGCKVRSLSQKYQVKVNQNENITELHFVTSISPQAPGQSAVLYRDEEIIGGGVIVGN